MPVGMFDCLVKGNNSFNKISLNLKRVSNCGRQFCTKLTVLFSLNAHMQGKDKYPLMATERAQLPTHTFLNNDPQGSGTFSKVLS